MFPLFPSALWMKIGAALALCAVMYFMGWNHEHKKFVQYKADVAALGKAQEQLNAALVEKHEVLSTSIKDEYEASLSAVHNYYTQRVQPVANSSPMPTVSKPTQCPVATTTDTVSARQCAETTLMLTELQKWVKGVTNAK